MYRLFAQTRFLELTRLQRVVCSYLIVTAAVAGLTVSPAAWGQTTWYVDDDAPADPGPGDPTISDPLEDGSADHPFDAIQEGIDAATDADTVLVADGTYTAVGNKNLDYAGKAITVRSENGPDTCVIDCENDGWGFHFHSGETADAIAEGFTITNGDHGIVCAESSPTIANCTVMGSTGAGISCWGGDPTITGCTITQNTGGWAGGIELFNGSATISNCVIADNAGIYYGGGIGSECADVTITACTITGNSVAGHDRYGGGVACLYGSAVITDSTIADNAGGGLYFHDNDPIIENCTITQNTAGTWPPGGGVSCLTDGDVIITGSTISGNTASGGGGVGYWGDGDLVVADCTISENSVQGSGGGIEYGEGGRLTISNCAITHNAAASNGPGLGGGGIECFGEAAITDSTISGNTAAIGGGIRCWGHSSIANCVITTNEVLYDGGGVYCYASDATIANCLIANNSADLHGGGVLCCLNSSSLITNCNIIENTANSGAGVYCENNSNSTIVGCAISGNTASYVGGGIACNYDSSPTITNCILWNDTPYEIYVANGSPLITYCDVDGGWEGEGNIDADPLFVDPDNGDYHLLPGSPCFDAGDNTAVPPDTLDLDGDGDTDEPLPYDLDGRPRFVDDPLTEDTGNGDPPIVDMGAYEHQVWYVDDDAPNDPAPGDPTVSDPLEDGSPDHPFDAIQEGIDATLAGDTLLVLDGTYTGAGNNGLDYDGKPITVRSANGPDTCIIDCEHDGEGFSFWHRETSDAVVDGFTITNGRGIDCSSSSPTVINCTFTGNVVDLGGAGMHNHKSSPTVANCTFHGNWGSCGGAMCNYSSSPTVTNCTFTENTASIGAGMSNSQSSPTVTNCTFTGNAAGFGAGMYNGGSSSRPTVTNCTFNGNSADRDGAGMLNDYARPTVANCTFSENSAASNGGGMYNYRSSATLANCTIVENSAALIAGGLYCYGDSTVTVANSILWDNSAMLGAEITLEGSSQQDDYSTLTLAYCDIPGDQEAVHVADGCTLIWGSGNIDADPLFADPNDADYHLSTGSPCIDAGCNCAVPEDFIDLDGDGILWEYTPFDLDGEGRFFDDPDTPDSGSGLPPIVDMGAYEFGGSDSPPCHGDLDGDRDVDLDDLAVLLAHYGMSEGANGADGDMDCDGDIEISDLAEFLGAYGDVCE